jgi:hypothetical protein
METMLGVDNALLVDGFIPECGIVSKNYMFQRLLDEPGFTKIRGDFLAKVVFRLMFAFEMYTDFPVRFDFKVTTDNVAFYPFVEEVNKDVQAINSLLHIKDFASLRVLLGAIQLKYIGMEDDWLIPSARDNADFFVEVIWVF